MGYSKIIIGKPSVTNLVSKLNIPVQPKYRKFKNEESRTGRLNKMRLTVSSLVKYERIETSFHNADESRGYIERLISEAIRFGELHRPTMNLAKYWIEDEAVVPKLFKVLVPRYKDWPTGLPYTRMLRAPGCIRDHLNYVQMGRQAQQTWSVLELRGNPFPSLPGPFAKPHAGAIHNILLEEARKEYFRSQSNVEAQAEQSVNADPVPEEDSALPDDPDGPPEEFDTTPRNPRAT